MITIKELEYICEYLIGDIELEQVFDIDIDKEATELIVSYREQCVQYEEQRALSTILDVLAYISPNSVLFGNKEELIHDLNERYNNKGEELMEKAISYIPLKS